MRMGAVGVEELKSHGRFTLRLWWRSWGVLRGAIYLAAGASRCVFEVKSFSKPLLSWVL